MVKNKRILARAHFKTSFKDQREELLVINDIQKRKCYLIHSYKDGKNSQYVNAFDSIKDALH